MEKEIKRNIFVIVIIILFLSPILSPVSGVEIHKENELQVNQINEDYIKINILNCGKDEITLTEKTLSSNQIEKLINDFFEIEMTEESFYEQAKKKILILEQNELISSERAKFLLIRFQTYEKIVNFQNKNNPMPSAADVGSLFNLIVFSIKGEKEFSLGEFFFPQFEFFNGTISGRFSILGSWVGKGFIFTLGILGFRYIYEFDQELYPEFPHMPDIKGTNLGFIGIFIDIYADNPDIQGQYFIGVGTTILTIWNRV
jgi:hypothetical protein